MSYYSLYFKPLLDIVVSLSLLLILFPLFLLIIIISVFFNKGDVFFSQNRPGKFGRIFKIYKFQTMSNKKDADGKLLPDIDRITPYGKLLRSTSLDELPQLYNVLKGDLSLIGPRPLLIEYLQLYNFDQKKRQNVKPGITGWAQVNGRNAISWNKKFELDVWYVNNISFLLDMRILYLTVKKVIKSEGISSETSPTMEKFNGNN
jgi:lipopolysaccharide/colanic/teichoic acid biosynthesis glycosyltransferase